MSADVKHVVSLTTYEPVYGSIFWFQKTNIIRDYLEDINEIPAPRMFWPHEIWGKFGTKLEVRFFTWLYNLNVNDVTFLKRDKGRGIEYL